MMPPTFFKPATVDLLVSWSADVASSAPQLPFLYYHIPSMTGVEFKMTDYVAAGEQAAV